ncbi:MAG: thioredoxin [Alphaproteobacteria bacterium]|nr:thioredoxin [Alphaproteobacteria bacterium]
MEILNDTDFGPKVLEAKKPVLVDFFATWCGPCRQMLPIVTEISEELPEIDVYKMDVDEAPNTPETLDIQSLPTLIIFKDGKPVAKKTGAMLKTELVSWIKSNI